MKNIEFQFSVLIHDKATTLEINMPYEGGLVYGGQSCPYNLRSQNVTERPFHWYRAEEFVTMCDNQLHIVSHTSMSKHLTGALSDAVIQAVHKTIERLGYITFNRLISELDCFSLIRNSLCDEQDIVTIMNEYHYLSMYLIDCFPKQCIYGNPPMAIKESPIYTELKFR